MTSTRQNGAMRYYSDGLHRMIRVHADSDYGTEEFFWAKSEIKCADGSWHDYGDNRLNIEIGHSGYQWPCDENGVPFKPTIKD